MKFILKALIPFFYILIQIIFCINVNNCVKFNNSEDIFFFTGFDLPENLIRNVYNKGTYEMQMQFLFVLSTILDVLNAIYLNYEDDVTKRSIRKIDQEFEPITISKKSEKLTSTSKNFNCDEFSSYAVNCTIDAAFIYNSSRMSPPLPTKINDWCRAIKHLTNCAIDWNSDCKDVTDSHFNEESIKGHIHVVNNICDDEWFLIRYDELTICIEEASEHWEFCYMTFKNSVEEQKNSTREWTHYEVHFQLCCARARFRRCTLESVFAMPNKCFHDQAVTLQKFSIIVSEGSVYQDCDRNMMYTNCPGGDPRPTAAMVKRLMKADVLSSSSLIRCQLPIYLHMIIIFYK